MPLAEWALGLVIRRAYCSSGYSVGGAVAQFDTAIVRVCTFQSAAFDQRNHLKAHSELSTQPRSFWLPLKASPSGSLSLHTLRCEQPNSVVRNIWGRQFNLECHAVYSSMQATLIRIPAYSAATWNLR